MFNANKTQIEITAVDKTAGAFDSVVNRLKRTTSEFSSFQKLLSFGALSVGVGSFATATIRAIDTYTKFNAQLKIATNSTREFNQAQENVLQIAQRAQTDISAIGSTYARLNNALRDFGATQNQISSVTETLALSLKANGASADEAASAMLQLSQAFGKGKLDGDEFRTAMEAAPNVMRALAQSMGVPFGALKDLAAQGKITSQVMLTAFNDPALLNALRLQADQTKTVTGEWENFTTRLTLAIGKINEATGASRLLIGVLEKAGTLLSVFQGGEKGSRLRNFLDTIVDARRDQLEGLSKSQLKFRSNFDSFAEEILNERLAKEKAIATAPLGRADSNAIIAPNFSAGIEAQDINKIRALAEDKKRQEEIRANNFKQEKQRAEELARKKLETEQRLYDISSGFDKQLRDREIEHIEKVEKEQERIAKDRAETAQRYFEFEEKKRKEIDQEQQEAARRIAEEQTRFYDQLGDNLSRALTEGLFDSFKKGESFGRAMLRNITAFGKTAIAQIFQGIATNSIRGLFSGGGASALGGLGSIFSGSASAGPVGGGFGGGLGGLSGIADIFQRGNSALVSSIESLGTFLSTGTGGLGDILGGALGQYAGTISNVLPFAGAAFNLLQGNFKGAAGSALGAALSFTPLGPIGGIIGGLIGGSLFGGKDYDRFGSSTRGSLKNGVFSEDLRGVVFDKDIGAGTAVAKVSKDFFNLFDSFVKELGGSITSFRNGTEVYQRGKSGITGGNFGAVVDGTKISLSVALKDSDLNAVFKALTEKVFGEGLAKAIQASNVNAGFKKYFDGLVKQEDVLNTVSALVSLNTQLKSLPSVFDGIRTAIDTTAFKTSISDLQKQFNDTNIFTSLFYSAEENFATFTKQITAQLTGLNQVVPKTRDEFRALVDGYKVTDEASSKIFGGLVALAPAMDAYFKQLEAQRQQFAGLNADFFSTSSDFLTGSALAGSGRSFTGEIGELSTVRQKSDAQSSAVVQALVEAQADTRALLEAVAKAVQETARIQKIWNGDGLPETRVI